MPDVSAAGCSSVEDASAEWDLSAVWESLSDAGKQGPTTTTPAALDFSESRAEIQFYLEYGFVDEAFSAIERLQEKFPNHPQVQELQSMVKQQAERAIGETSPLADTFTSAAIDLTESAAPEREIGAVPGCEAGDDGQTADVFVNDLCFLGESTSVIEEPLGLPPGAPAADSPVPGSTPGEPVACESGSGVSALDAMGPAQSCLQEALPTAKDQMGSCRSNSPEASSPENGYTGDLSTLLAELDSAPEQSAVYEDIDVHYNLAVAFHEMELLDEAIGEFQRVVKGAEKELPSPCFLQACSLLAHCFTKKQMPELAVRWYQRALESPDLDGETRLALQYEMGVAYERAGDPRASLEYLLDVYSQNIDYRDVAERIRALQYKPIAKDHAGGSGRLHPSSLPANLNKSDASQLRPSPK
jgi:tetratricopeptide (TPR) repeat protein